MRKILVVIAAGALVMGACGGGGDGGPDPSDDPQAALIEALRDLTEEPFSMTFSIASDQESLSAAFEGDTDVPEDVVETILDSSITVASNNETAPGDVQGELILELAGEEAAAFLIDGYDLYAHADVPYIMETFGADPSTLEQQLAGIPPGLGFVDQAVEGEWIHLTGLEEFVQQAEESGQTVPDIAEQQKKIVDGFTTALEDNSEVAEGDEEGPGTHLEATVDAQGVGQDVQQLFGQVAGVPIGDGELSDADDLPQGEVVIDAWVDDGTLKQVEFDIVKNAEVIGGGEEMPEGISELGVLLVFEDFDGETDPPDDAVEVSFQEILAGVMSGGFGTGGTSTDSGSAGTAVDPCEEVAKLPAEQQEPFKDICPDL